MRASFCTLQSYKEEIGLGNCQNILCLGRTVPKSSFCQLAGQEENISVKRQEYIAFKKFFSPPNGWSIWVLLDKPLPVLEHQVFVLTPWRWNLILWSPQGFHTRAETPWAAFVAVPSLPAPAGASVPLWLCDNDNKPPAQAAKIM